MAIINTRLVHHAQYQISSIEIPFPTHNAKKSNLCVSEIESISFVTLDAINIQTTRRRITTTNNNYHIYTLQHTINIPPSQIHHIIIQLSWSNEANICPPTSITLPIINTAIKLLCTHSYNLTISTIYTCTPSISSTPNTITSTFYPMDNEYISGLLSYNNYKRRLYDNNTSLSTLQSNKKQMDMSPSSNFRSLFIWIIIGALCLLTPITCCFLYCICFKSNLSRHKKVHDTFHVSECEILSPKMTKSSSLSAIDGPNPSHRTDITSIPMPGTTKLQKIPSISTSFITGTNASIKSPKPKYNVIPIQEDDDNISAKLKLTMLEMAHLEPTKTPHREDFTSSSSPSPTDSAHQERKCITPMECADNQRTKLFTPTDNKSGGNLFNFIDETEPVKHRKSGQRIRRNNTDSITDSNFSTCSDDAKSGYEQDLEDIDAPRFPPFKSNSLGYLALGLPDENEDAAESDAATENVRNVHRRSNSLGDIDDYKQQKRDSMEIDHENLYNNVWGTSLPIHENERLFKGKEELNKYKFFYNSPKIKTVTPTDMKLVSFKKRIKEDVDATKELEDDVINQMITDSEMSTIDSMV